jgi:hypothetical protein
MIPDLPVDELDPENLKHFGGDVSERAVYRALKEQLPDNWVVRYNYLFCYKKAGKRCPDGQADFIVVIPGNGLLFFEVKGAAGLVSQNGQYYWLQDNGSLGNSTENPFDQAQANKHNIIKILRDTLYKGKAFPGLYGHLVAFPRAKGKVPSSHDEEIAICFDGMGDLKNRVMAAIHQFGDAQIAQQFTSVEMGRVVEKLEDNAKFIPVMAADVAEDNRKIEALTLQQWTAFRGLLSNQRVEVNGVAGSGKTVLALWAAEHYAAEGLRVLFLCYNKLLKNWIDLTQPKPDRAFEVETFHSLVGRYCADAKTPFAAKVAEDWDNVAPNAILDALDLLGDQAKFDVIVVDEAQDFRHQWWMPVEFLLKGEEAKLLIFSDPLQRLYNTAAVHILTHAKYELLENCRNTQAISAVCGTVAQTAVNQIAEPDRSKFHRTVLKNGIRGFGQAPIGVEPSVLPAVPDVKTRVQKIERILLNWLNEGYRASQMAVLSPWAETNASSVLGKFGVVNGCRIQGGFENLKGWQEGRLILGETIKAFKGLEADCLIISDVPPKGTKGFELEDLYVAASRAKHRLILLPSNQPAADHLTEMCQTKDFSPALQKP